MAACSNSKWLITYCFAFSLLNTVVICVRYGQNARTLHFPRRSVNSPFHEKTFVLEADLSSRTENVNTKVVDALKRSVRSASSPGSHVPVENVAQLNDSHSQMIVHWAGVGSDVIIALAKDTRPTNTSNSELFISFDYGKHFSNRNSIMYREYPNYNPCINHYFNSKSYNSYYIFADIVHNIIFTTTDYGQTFKSHRVPFRPKTISIHPNNPYIVLGMDDEKDQEKRLYLSQNFGENWNLLQSDIKSFFWGVPPYDGDTDIYVERQQFDGGYSVLKSTDYFDSIQTILTDVEDFEVRGEYLFATRKAHLFGSRNNNGSLQFWVSYKRGRFVNAEFSHNAPRQDFYVADASEGQIFLCVNHNRSSSHLYISDATGSKFTLSLENIVYFNPKGAHKDSWLRYFTDESFADIHKVDGLRGVYIASQFINSSFNAENQRSLITYDKGGEWRLITAPRFDRSGKPTNCSTSSNCSLHLSQEFQRLHPGSRWVPILSKKSAPGIIMATGVVGANMKRDPDVYLSTDAGLNWHMVLDDNYYFQFGDHGGVIVAIRQFVSTDEIFYSTDEGETWKTAKFHDEKIRVYGVLTEPGEKTAVFSIFGSHLGRHSWIIIQLNLTDVFQYPQCDTNDYKIWSFPDQLPSAGCILGKKIEYERRDAHANCYNGEDYVREVNERNCTCTRDDFECDLGFDWSRDPFEYFMKCNPDPKSGIEINKVPSPCPPGQYFQFSRGYRKVVGDTCRGGEESKYSPLTYSCPVRELPEFILYSTKTDIRRYLFGENRDEVLFANSSLIGEISAVDFDYAENCIIWADIQKDTINRLCLDGNHAVETLISRGLQTVVSLAYDWTAGNIYWVDAGTKKIVVASKNGRYETTLFNSTKLDEPRGLTLDTHFGWMYWTDWSTARPRIVRAYMDGTSSSYSEIVIGGHVHWPNGITIDHATDRIYWTDTYLHRISSAKLNGSNVKVLVQGSFYLPHPYSLGIYKNLVYWTDWQKRSIMSSDKTSGSYVAPVVNNINNVMSLKIVHNTSQHSISACSRANGHCSQLCLPHPQLEDMTQKNRTCRCDDRSGFFSHNNDGNQKCTCLNGTLINGECVNRNSSGCGINEIQCRNESRCIPSTWLCDHDDDCTDASDEDDCTYSTCSGEQFTCKSNSKCIPLRWKCDYDDDCGDGSDEENCVYRNCTSTEFQCANGRCIVRTWKCDYDDDCHDGSDELQCNYNVTCGDDEFNCVAHHPQCVAGNRRCDGIRDCGDGSDEDNCNNNTCTGFKCKNGNCIDSSWVCDGMNDCHDGGRGSDEKNCSSVTTMVPLSTTTRGRYDCRSYQFMCNDGRCINWLFYCDGVPDCVDSSDEANCGTSRPTLHPNTTTCSFDMFRCNNGRCVGVWLRCDGRDNCGDNSDEYNCRTTSAAPPTCAIGTFSCDVAHDPKCIPQSWVCDNSPDCTDETDEKDCSGSQHCGAGYFHCINDGGCIRRNKVCDGRRDCTDGTDEGLRCHTGTTATPLPPLKCPNNGYHKCNGERRCVLYMDMCSKPCLDFYSMMFCARPKVIQRIFVKNVLGKTALLAWVPVNSTIIPNPVYIVSYMEQSNNNSIRNITVPDNSSSYNLTNLSPLTTYKVTVYVKKKGPNSRVYYPPPPPTFFTTAETTPSKPVNFRVFPDTNDATKVILTWTSPGNSKGTILRYHVYYQSTTSKDVVYRNVPAGMRTDFTFQLSDEDLTFGKEYKFWVTAFTVAGEGQATDKKTLLYDTGAIHKVVTNLLATANGSSAVLLSWKSPFKDPKIIKDYVVSYQDSWDDEQTVTTIDTKITIDKLCWGYQYAFDVQGHNDHGTGPVSSVVYNASGNVVEVPKDLKFDISASRQLTVKWKSPAGAKAGTEYTVYYSYNPTDLEDRNIAKKASHQSVTDSNNLIISNLRSCESYSFRIAITSPGKCPLSPVYTKQIGSDVRGKPEEIHFGQIDATSGKLSWQAPCPFQVMAVGYMVSVQEGNKKPRSFTPYRNTTDFRLSMLLTKLIRGANYTVWVKSTVNASSLSEKYTFAMPAISEPLNFRRIFETSGTIRLVWDRPENFPTTIPVTYDIFEKQTEFDLKATHSHQDAKFLFLKNTNQTTILIKPKPGVKSSYKVRVAAYQGYPGTFSYIVDAASTLIIEPAPQTVVLSKTNVIAIAVSVSVVVIALVVVLSFFIIRHRRLQRSFLAFANSHYDTRSGTTTFTAANELDEDEDSPMIRGFSDDEPLVIA